MPISIVPYNSQWPLQFQRLKAVFDDALSGMQLPVEHVGSTAVPGMVAKPVLDIDIVIENDEQLQLVIPAITRLGYHFVGDRGIKGRYAFKALSPHSPLTGNGTVWPAHHLYCCLKSSDSLRNHLLFKNALINSPLLAKQYAELKIQLAYNTDDMDVYVESKGGFIAGVLKDAGFDIRAIEDIIEQNRKK